MSIRTIIENYMCPECKDADDKHICKDCDIVDRQEEEIKKLLPKKKTRKKLFGE